MSGIVAGINYSLLFGTSGTSAGTGDLLGTLYGFASASAGASTANPIPALQDAEANETKDVAAAAKQPDVARDMAAFNSAVAAAKSPKDLLANPTVLKVLLTANGLGSQVQYTALAQKALLSDTTQTDSLANKLAGTNAAWKSTAETYDFANKGLSVIQNPKVLSTIANGYAEVVWRQSLDAKTPGLSNALTFRAQAGTITSVDQILGDATLRTVVTTALGVPEQIAFQTLNAQEKAISSRLDVTQFKDKGFVERFTQRYLLAAQAAAQSSTTTQPDLTTLATQARGLVV